MSNLSRLQEKVIAGLIALLKEQGDEAIDRAEVAEVELKIAQDNTDAAIADYNDMKAERDRLREGIRALINPPAAPDP